MAGEAATGSAEAAEAAGFSLPPSQRAEEKAAEQTEESE
jgi:hypothetical protein